MKLKNKRTKMVVSHNIFEAKSLKERLLGLLGTKRNLGLIIHTRFGIHTFGMDSPIDVLILNREKKVVKIKSNLKPNRIFLWNPKYQTVIELPQGKIKQKELRIGDKILYVS